MTRIERKARAIGIDCCDESCKTVVLSRRGSGVVITGATYLSCKAEGFLSIGELQHSFGEWLSHNGLRKHHACCGLPQFQVNTLITDLPPVNNHGKMAQMVDYQTRHLGGLSGEELINDFHELPPTQSLTNPVLIALCRSSLLDEQLAYMNDCRALIAHFSGNGIALANAFQTLQPVAFANGALQAVIDAGNEESILALYFQRSLQLIAVLPGLKEQNSHQRLAAEASAVIRRWQEGYRGIIPPQLTQLWFSGEGALDEQLPWLVSAELGRVPVSILGVPLHHFPQEAYGGPVTSGVYPCLTLAYGLALQALGAAPISIALIPEQLAARKRKADAYPWLFSAWCLLVILLGLVLFRYHHNTRQMHEALAAREKAIDQCLATIPQLENAYHQIDYQQRRMLPIAEIGYRSRRFLDTLQTWQKAEAKRDTNQEWCIYMADEFSFAEANKKQTPPAENEQESDRKPASRRSKTELPGLRTTGAETPAAPTASVQPESNDLSPESTNPAVWSSDAIMPVTRMPLLRSMYLAGVVPQDESRYQAVMELQKELNDSECFENVDDYADLASAEFKKQYLSVWDDFLKSNRQKLKQDYTVFLLQLPFSKTSVTPPLPPIEETQEQDEDL